MAVGDTVNLTRMTVEITALTSDGRPQEVLYRFSVPLEDPSLHWLQWKEGGYVSFAPPPIGETLNLPPALGPFERFLWIVQSKSS